MGSSRDSSYSRKNTSWIYGTIITSMNQLGPGCPTANPPAREAFDEGFSRVAKSNIVFAVLVDPAHLNYGAGDPDPEKFEAVGLCAYGGDLNPKNRTLETGVMFGPVMQRTVASTEANYLMLRNVFDPKEGPRYRRVSWKTNSFNEASRRAAERLGYVYEGTFRNDMIDCGKSRDSAWFSIVDDEWVAMKKALEMWLEKENFGEDGRQIRRLDDIKKSLK